MVSAQTGSGRRLRIFVLIFPPLLVIPTAMSVLRVHGLGCVLLIRLGPSVSLKPRSYLTYQPHLREFFLALHLNMGLIRRAWGQTLLPGQCSLRDLSTQLYLSGQISAWPFRTSGCSSAPSIYCCSVRTGLRIWLPVLMITFIFGWVGMYVPQCKY